MSVESQQAGISYLVIRKKRTEKQGPKKESRETPESDDSSEDPRSKDVGCSEAFKQSPALTSAAAEACCNSTLYVAMLLAVSFFNQPENLARQQTTDTSQTSALELHLLINQDKSSFPLVAVHGGASSQEVRTKGHTFSGSDVPCCHASCQEPDIRGTGLCQNKAAVL